MKNLIILAHPDDQSLQASLFSSIGEALKQKGDRIVSSDLYAQGFPPLLSLEEIQRGSSTEEMVIQHQRDLRDCDRLFLCYPDWWGMPPAILKGWLDRVLSTETAFSWEGEDFLEKTWVPLLKDKEALVFVSSDGRLDPHWLEQLWDAKILGKCGMKVVVRPLDRLRQRDFHEIRDWIDDQIGSL